MVNHIRNTTTQQGLEVNAILNENKYEKGIKISAAQIKELNIKKKEQLPQWNYTIRP